MTSNAGPSVGLCTRQNSTFEFLNCRFVSTHDGTYGTSGNGAFFAHSDTVQGERINQNLIVHDCIAISKNTIYGGKLSYASGHNSGCSYELQNFGCFGRDGANIDLTNADPSILSPYNFNNKPNTLNA